MRRPLMAVVLLAGLTAALVAAWSTISRDREYTRLLAVGEAELAAGRTLGAIEAFSGAIALRKDSMVGWLKRGETYRRHGDLDAAMRDLRMASALDPTATRALEQLGDAYYLDRRYSEAADRYAAYLRLDDQSPRLLYKLALARYQEGHLEGSIESLQRALRIDDELAEAHHLFGLALHRQGRADEAIAALRRAARLAPGLPAPREALAEVYGATGRHRERLEQLEALAALEPERPIRLVALGLAHAEAGRPDLAVLAIGRAAERQPGEPAAYAALAEIWLRAADRGDRSALMKALEAARLAVANGNPGSRELRLYGHTLLASGEPELGLHVLRDATRRFPVDPHAFVELAGAAEQLGHLDEARRGLVSYLALSPDDRPLAATAARIGELSLRLDEPDAAVLWFTRATRFDPADAMLLGWLAKALLEAGDLAKAHQTYLQALQQGAAAEAPLMRELSTQLKRDR